MVSIDLNTWERNMSNICNYEIGSVRTRADEWKGWRRKGVRKTNWELGSKDSDISIGVTYFSCLLLDIKKLQYYHANSTTTLLWYVVSSVTGRKDGKVKMNSWRRESVNKRSAACTLLSLNHKSAELSWTQSLYLIIPEVFLNKSFLTSLQFG